MGYKDVIARLSVDEPKMVPSGEELYKWVGDVMRQCTSGVPELLTDALLTGEASHLYDALEALGWGRRNPYGNREVTHNTLPYSSEKTISGSTESTTYVPDWNTIIGKLATVIELSKVMDFDVAVNYAEGGLEFEVATQLATNGIDSSLFASLEEELGMTAKS